MNATLDELLRLHAGFRTTAAALPAGWDAAECGAAGPPVVAMPGVQGSLLTLARLVADLGRDHRVTALDYPAIPDGLALARSLPQVLDALGIERATFVAPTWTGWWIQRFSAASPERVERLVLVCSYADPTPVRGRYPIPSDPDACRALASTLFDRVIGEYPAEANDLRAMKDIVTQQQRSDRLAARLAGSMSSGPAERIGIDESRLLSIDAADDLLVAPEMKEQLRERYPRGRHVRLESGGHYSILTRAPRIATLIREANG